MIKSRFYFELARAQGAAKYLLAFTKSLIVVGIVDMSTLAPWSADVVKTRSKQSKQADGREREEAFCICKQDMRIYKKSDSNFSLKLND